MKDSKYFTTSKNITDPFFKATKVDSCSHVLVKNGQSLAVPFKIKNEKGNMMKCSQGADCKLLHQDIKGMQKQKLNNIVIGMSKKMAAKGYPAVSKGLADELLKAIETLA
jgi:hypothetical protein